MSNRTDPPLSERPLDAPEGAAADAPEDFFLWDAADDLTPVARRTVRPWTAVLFGLEVLVVVGLVWFSWTSGSWS